MASRFIASVRKTAANTTAKLPWQRGARRKAFIAKRRATGTERKTA